MLSTFLVTEFLAILSACITICVLHYLHVRHCLEQGHRRLKDLHKNSTVLQLVFTIYEHV